VVLSRLLAAAAAVLALSGCAGTSCDALAGLRAERDALRTDYLALARSGATGAESEAADGRLHALERRVYDLERDCDEVAAVG
jgi:hypothetical protein